MVRLEFDDLFNVWVGRMVLPVDRANPRRFLLHGHSGLPAQQLPVLRCGPRQRRDRVGATGGGKFKYQVGAFQGCSDDAPCSTGSNRGRQSAIRRPLELCLWDPELGYYPATDYLGQKEILSVGLSTALQEDATGTATDSR